MTQIIPIIIGVILIVIGIRPIIRKQQIWAVSIGNILILIGFLLILIGLDLIKLG